MLMYSQKIKFLRPKYHSELPIDLSGKPANTIKDDVANGKLKLEEVCKIVITTALNKLPNAPKKYSVAKGDLPLTPAEKKVIQNKSNISSIERKLADSKKLAAEAWDVIASLRKDLGFNVMEDIRKKYEDICQKNGKKHLESMIQGSKDGLGSKEQRSEILLYNDYSYQLMLHDRYSKDETRFLGELTTAKEELCKNELEVRSQKPERSVENLLDQLKAAQAGKEAYYGYAFTAEKTYISTRENSIFDQIAFFFSCNFGAINRAAKLIEQLS